MQEKNNLLFALNIAFLQGQYFSSLKLTANPMERAGRHYYYFRVFKVQRLAANSCICDKVS
ncbi:hypothetical protein [Leclercia adecarboxylata]|uniref:hypothetical protein n=1 Tax=Leclercia adecarboxylata TaxID=83655 RepID=UPI0013CC4AC7|nr:hypothetical protein [Leclercia adecarboxylata]NEG91902.1 hypothetical protein [Leclercia adecarboxylata]